MTAQKLGYAETNPKLDLNGDDEIDLAKLIKKGGFEGELALERLVKANLRFVCSAVVH